MKQILLTTIAFLAISLSFAQKTDVNPKFDIEKLEESSKEQLKKFLKSHKGTLDGLTHLSSPYTAKD